jgi:hypothetical protein
MILLQRVSAVTYRHFQGVPNIQRIYVVEVEVNGQKNAHNCAVTVSIYDVKNDVVYIIQDSC